MFLVPKRDPYPSRKRGNVQFWKIRNLFWSFLSKVVSFTNHIWTQTFSKKKCCIFSKWIYLRKHLIWGVSETRFEHLNRRVFLVKSQKFVMIRKKRNFLRRGYGFLAHFWIKKQHFLHFFVFCGPFLDFTRVALSLAHQKTLILATFEDFWTLLNYGHLGVF